MTTKPIPYSISRRVAQFTFCACLAFFALNQPLSPQTAAKPGLVRGAELPSAYGAPVSFSQSRFSPTTNAYVLPPGAVYSSLIYENDVVHFRSPDHTFTQET